MKKHRVYLVLGDDDYPYGIFSTWNRAYSWIRAELKAGTNEENLIAFYKSHPKDLGNFDIEPFTVDERYGESH